MVKQRITILSVVALAITASLQAQVTMSVVSCWNTLASQLQPDKCSVVNPAGAVSASITGDEEFGYLFQAKALDVATVTAQAVLNYKEQVAIDNDYILTVSAAAQSGATYDINLIVGNRQWLLTSTNGANVPKSMPVHITAGQFVMAYIVVDDLNGPQKAGVSIYLVPSQ